MNQELQDYIKKSKEAGFNDEQIKQELLKTGWREEDINQAFNGAPASNPVSMSAPIPEKKGIIYYYLAVFKKYATFNGRAQRAEYWYFFLANIIIGVILAAIGFIIKDKGILGGLYALALIIPGIAVTVRRLHDTDHSGGWWFISLIPIIGTIILLIFMAQDSQPGANKYGPNPK
jgi:uncharacterized membrane protein YhaH (DUF805 family)